MGYGLIGFAFVMDQFPQLPFATWQTQLINALCIIALLYMVTKLNDGDSEEEKTDSWMEELNYYLCIFGFITFLNLIGGESSIGLDFASEGFWFAAIGAFIKIYGTYEAGQRARRQLD
ncbi:hypothetical protein [Salinicoccus sp. RF5]|uniref:hypothetical protein n=1 Tax=Salinicoccus sp. RF5 TaxID=2748874 RepID=UPI001E5B2F64|nr:hypothetical protein [Salinicoccus sp. RF5]MCC4722260.1 hypothetical protein [Salinicoccus sp. RF5]